MKQLLSISCFRVIFCIISIVVASHSISSATPEYSERSEQGCLTCHVDEEGGGRLTTKGLEFAASGYLWPPMGGYRVIGPVRKSVRLGIGLLHIIAAFLWFGTILYVHIMLRPGYAARGLPRGEVALGLVSMILVGISGILLTVSRIRSIDVLFMSQWGQLLSLKIIFYTIMVASALFTVLFIGPRLKRGQTRARVPDNKIFDPVTLQAFDGKDDSPAYIAFKGKVYDMSTLKLWQGGTHMKHQAGRDHTGSLAKAPHGEEKLETLNLVGTYDVTLKPSMTFAQKAFYCIAYMNLCFVFIVLFVIAFWRWGM